MREIIFRGQRKDNGEWVEGFYMCLGKYAYILTGQLDITLGYPDLIKYSVIPETVGQYTGLTDKNETKIFEGDIVKFVNNIDEINAEEIGICEFTQDESNFCLHRTVKNPENYYVPYTTETIYLIDNEKYNKYCWYEVISNIHDNPELLEVE